MTAYLMSTPQQFFDNNGDPLNGGKVYTCIAGASGITSGYWKTSYTDATGLTANTNPVILDSSGRPSSGGIYGDAGAYKLFVYNSSNVLIDTQDNVYSFGVVADGTIGEDKIADGAITTDKISNESITLSKLYPVGTSGYVLTSTGTSTPPSYQTKYSTGNVIQVVYADPYTTYESTTTVIPNDNTIPQITEGREFVTVSITPTSATSIIFIDVCTGILFNSASNIVLALFRDSNANSICSTFTSTGLIGSVNLSCSVLSGSTSATTFKLRIGTSNASNATFINGNSSSRLLGGASSISITATEIKA